MMTEPRWPVGVHGKSVQTQGSSLREQPWALIRNSVGVEDIDNSDQCQISSSFAPNNRERRQRRRRFLAFFGQILALSTHPPSENWCQV